MPKTHMQRSATHRWQVNVDRDNLREKEITDKEHDWKVNKEENWLGFATKGIKHTKALHGQRKTCAWGQRFKEGRRSRMVLWLSQKEVERRYYPWLWLCVLQILRVGSEQKIRPKIIHKTKRVSLFWVLIKSLWVFSMTLSWNTEYYLGKTNWLAKTIISAHFECWYCSFEGVYKHENKDI